MFGAAVVCNKGAILHTDSLHFCIFGAQSGGAADKEKVIWHVQ